MLKRNELIPLGEHYTWNLSMYTYVYIHIHVCTHMCTQDTETKTQIQWKITPIWLLFFYQPSDSDTTICRTNFVYCPVCFYHMFNICGCFCNYNGGTERLRQNDWFLKPTHLIADPFSKRRVPTRSYPEIWDFSITKKCNTFNWTEPSRLQA